MDFAYSNAVCYIFISRPIDKGKCHGQFLFLTFRGDFVVYLGVSYLCGTLLFLLLLEQRHKLITTAIIYTAAFFMGFLISSVAGIFLQDSALHDPVCIFLHALVLFITSLFISHNNPAIKLYLVFLSLSNYAFAALFTELTLGMFPFSTAGAFSAVYSVFITVLVHLLSGLCLYRYFHYFSDRLVSGFEIIMLLMQLIPYIFCAGYLDFVFKAHFDAGRMMIAALTYLFIIFCFRSVYYAARFRERTTLQAAHQKLIETESAMIFDMLGFIRELGAETKENEYALDSISIMLLDGQSENVAEYISRRKAKHQNSRLLEQFHENPYVNAVLASNAAAAKALGIDFECNVDFQNGVLKLSECCIIINELLKKSCADAREYTGERRIRFTTAVTPETITFESIYTALLPEEEKWTPKGKSMAEILSYLFDEHTDSLPRALANTEDIVERYSGSLNISGADESTIIRAVINL